MDTARSSEGTSPICTTPSSMFVRHGSRSGWTSFGNSSMVTSSRSTGLPAIRASRSVTPAGCCRPSTVINLCFGRRYRDHVDVAVLVCFTTGEGTRSAVVNTRGCGRQKSAYWPTILNHNLWREWRRELPPIAPAFGTEPSQLGCRLAAAAPLPRWDCACHRSAAVGHRAGDRGQGRNTPEASRCRQGHRPRPMILCKLFRRVGERNPLLL